MKPEGRKHIEATDLNDAVDKGVYAKGKPKTVYLSVRGNDVKITPSALRYVKKQTLKSMAAYGIDDTAAREVIPAALLAGAITASMEMESGTVTVADVVLGFNEIRLCPGNTPPYRCAVRSILGRGEDIYALPGLTGELLQEASLAPDQGDRPAVEPTTPDLQEEGFDARGD